MDVNRDRMERRERPTSLPRPHLSVHQASDGRSQPHLQHFESVHVLLLEQRLQAGGEKHQYREEIALPRGGLGVADKLQKKACGRGREKLWLVRQGSPRCQPGLEDQTVWQIFFFFLQKKCL